MAICKTFFFSILISSSFIFGEGLDECKYPNCVSSNSREYPVPTLRYNVPCDPLEGLLYAIEKESHYQMIGSTANEVHAVFYSSFFHLPSDFKARIDRDTHWITFSSKSRYGFYDFGSNKRRVERIIRYFQQWADQCSPPKSSS